MLAYNSQWIADLQDLSVDFMISLSKGIDPIKEAPHFIIMDIDNQTYRKWNEPALIPRDKLLDLLKISVNAKPKLIIVDFLLNSWQQTEAGKLQDIALKNYLDNYEETYCKIDCPHILLAQDLRLPENVIPYDPNAGHYYWEQIPSFLETTVEKSPHIHWASVFYDSENDNILRRWQLWTATCTNGKSAVLPSISLLSTTLLADPKNGAARLQKKLDDFTPNCSSDSKPLPLKHSVFKLNETLSFDLQASDINRRILYTIPWRISSGDKPQHTFESNKLLLKNYPAYQVLNIGVQKEALYDSITIISGSFLKGRDWHKTPLEWMPGSYVLVNSINSLQQYGILESPPSWQVFLLLFILLLILSAWFASNSWWKVQFPLLLLVSLILILISFYWQYGLWLFFAILFVIFDYFYRLLKITQVSNSVTIKDK